MSQSEMKPTARNPRRFLRTSFRSRLVWNTVFLVSITLAGTMAFALYGAGQISSYLTGELSKSVVAQSETQLKSASTQRANELDNFFLPVMNDMTTISNSIQSILAQEEPLNASAYWDARQVLITLPNGSWDNPNKEPASIFIPAGSQIPDSIYSELTALKQVDFIAPSMLQKSPETIAIYFGSEQGATVYYPNIDLASILPPDFDVRQRPWFRAAGPTQNPLRKVIWSVPYEDAALHGLVVTSSAPIYDSKGAFRGVVAMDIQLTSISNKVSSIQIGETGYAFLIDKDGRVLAMTDAGYADFGLKREDVSTDQGLQPILSKVSLDNFDTLIRMTTGQTGLRTLKLNGVDKYVAFEPVPSVGYSLGIVVPVSEMQGALAAAQQNAQTQSRNMILNIIGVTAFLLAISVVVSRALANTLTSPLVQLTSTAERLAEGDLSAETTISSEDEIGVLARAYNNMTLRLREMVGSLEQRVAERTADLTNATRQSEKRANDLETVSEVARAISSEVEIENLLSLVTNVVSERFGFYHVGVFMIDPGALYAVLRASNSPGGKRMVAHGHKLQVGEEGIVGHVASTGQPRIALNVGEDATYFNNPDLPETRSEMALPLSLRGRAIGVLDVQSTQANAFTSADVETLSILADQIAIAIENARLLSESTQALAESRTLYGDYVGRTWERKTGQNPIGYYHSAGSGQLIAAPVEWDEAQTVLKTGRSVVKTSEKKSKKKETVAAIAVPIRLQNQVIGVLDIRSTDPNHIWGEDEVAVIEATAERLALALENARLFEETSTRASREHAVAEISSKIRSTNDPQVMIRTAIEELQRVLGASRVEIIPQVVSAHLPGREHGPDESS